MRFQFSSSQDQRLTGCFRKKQSQQNDAKCQQKEGGKGMCLQGCKHFSMKKLQGSVGKTTARAWDSRGSEDRAAPRGQSCQAQSQMQSARSRNDQSITAVLKQAGKSRRVPGSANCQEHRLKRRFLSHHPNLDTHIQPVANFFEGIAPDMEGQFGRHQHHALHHEQTRAAHRCGG